MRKSALGCLLLLAVIGCSSRTNGRGGDAATDGATDANAFPDGTMLNDDAATDGATPDADVPPDAALPSDSGTDAATDSGTDAAVGPCAVTLCGDHASCDDSSGLPVCECDTGYSGDGTDCSDINECATDNGGCDVHATCGNFEGGSTCSCNPGFTGDGLVCVQDNVYKTCLDTRLNVPNSKSGVFDIKPVWTTYTVYCDMSKDGGGWTKILQYASDPYTPTAAAVGDIATSAVAGGFAKLSDVAINEIGASGRLYRIQGSRTTKRLYLRNVNTFDDTAVGLGLLGPLSATACEATSLELCDGTNTVSGIAPVFDTQVWGLSGDDCNRFEIDPGASIGCTNTMSTTERCFSAGATCTATANPMVKNVSIWVRESAGLVCELPFDEGAGNVAYDFSGGAHNFDVLPMGGWGADGVDGSMSSLDTTTFGRRAVGAGFLDLAMDDQPFTFAMWIKPAVNSGYLVHGSEDEDGGGDWCVPFLGFDGEGDLVAQVPFAAGDTAFLTAEATAPAVGDWYHVAMTWSALDGVRLYLNGALAAEGVPANVTERHYYASGSMAGIFLGLAAPGNAAMCANPAGVEFNVFDGQLDDFRVYNAALSSVEIADLAQ
jgi:hypothetical protein